MFETIFALIMIICVWCMIIYCLKLVFFGISQNNAQPSIITKQKTIPIKSILKHLAELTLESSAIFNQKNIKALEEMSFHKITRVHKTEILISEIFISHIPIQKLLAETSKENKFALLDMFYSEISKLLIEKYNYFEEGPEQKMMLELFNVLLQERYKEYYQIANMETNHSKKIAQYISLELFPNGAGLLEMGLTTNYNTNLVIINDKIEELKTKYTITFLP